MSKIITIAHYDVSKIYNGTGKDVNLYKLEDCYYEDNDNLNNYKKVIVQDHAKPILSIPTEIQSELKIYKQNSKIPDYPFGEYRENHPVLDGIPLCIKSCQDIIAYDNLPQGYNLYLVNYMYRFAVKMLGGETSKLAIPSKLVFDSNCNHCGFTYLSMS